MTNDYQALIEDLEAVEPTLPVKGRYLVDATVNGTREQKEFKYLKSVRELFVEWKGDEAVAVHAVLDYNEPNGKVIVRGKPANKVNTERKAVLQDWVCKLPYMQQGALLTSIRGPDGAQKRHPAKDLQRWYRRCVLNCALNGEPITNPYDPGGGSFTGPCRAMPIERVVRNFIDSYDDLPAHYWAHFMHGAEIIGYKHPEEHIRVFWYDVYERMVRTLHLYVPETEEELDSRLDDTLEGWASKQVEQPIIEGDRVIDLEAEDEIDVD